MEQFSLFDVPGFGENEITAGEFVFSADHLCEERERQKLESKYQEITEITDKFSRQSVSYQLSKNDRLHRWLKYKEGFSASLVEDLLHEFNIKKGDTILDPFMGSGTTLMVGMLNGIHSIGYDILPMSEIAIKAKTFVYHYDVTELEFVLDKLRNLNMPSDYQRTTPYLTITYGAYPDMTAREISFFTDWNDSNNYSLETKNLIKLCILNILEKISYASKDGQFLRWDCRSIKIVEANKRRAIKGLPPYTVKLDKGELPDFHQSLILEFEKFISDIKIIQNGSTLAYAEVKPVTGSVLYELPKLSSSILNGVITSPPYCNRYDYTRTYALELAYLGVDDAKIRDLRQALLSCTVESKSKIDKLREYYYSIGREKDFNLTYDIVKNSPVLNEIKRVLAIRNEHGDLNNHGVLRMVDGYFTEMTFVFSELFRLCKPGAMIAFVNDNVRYGGEVIPVDYISMELAHLVGFEPVKIYSLKQQKGNSSQQMKKFGRIALRKSIIIWKKL